MEVVRSVILQSRGHVHAFMVLLNIYIQTCGRPLNTLFLAQDIATYIPLKLLTIQTVFSGLR